MLSRKLKEITYKAGLSSFVASLEVGGIVEAQKTCPSCPGSASRGRTLNEEHLETYPSYCLIIPSMQLFLSPLLGVLSPITNILRSQCLKQSTFGMGKKMLSTHECGSIQQSFSSNSIKEAQRWGKMLNNINAVVRGK